MCDFFTWNCQCHLKASVGSAGDCHCSAMSLYDLPNDQKSQSVLLSIHIRVTDHVMRHMVKLFNLMEILVFLAVFVIAGYIAVVTSGITETLPLSYLLKWCAGLFLTMLPSLSVMWMLTVLFEKPLLSVGLNLLLVIPGLLAGATPAWFLYPYCYSGYLVSRSLQAFTTEVTADTALQLFPFIPCAVLIFTLALFISASRFCKQT